VTGVINVASRARSIISVEDVRQVRTLIRADDSFFTSSKVSTAIPAMFLHLSNPFSFFLPSNRGDEFANSAVCWLIYNGGNTVGLSRRQVIDLDQEQPQPVISINNLLP
jgi:hypothetical protein